MIRKYSVLLGTILLLWSCNGGESASAVAQPHLSIATFKSGEGWGYRIASGNKDFIRQAYIPAIQGNVPFATERQASAAAQMVVARLHRRESPALSIGELRQIGIEIPTNTNHKQ